MKHGIIICIIWVVSIITVIAVYEPEDHWYYMQDECGSWVEVVDRPCIVTEVCDGIIVVETRTTGEVFEFYGDGFRVNERIWCTFTVKGELIFAR